MKKNSKIFIAGHSGLVGSAIIRLLEKEKFSNLITSSHKDLDLTNQKSVQVFFEKSMPDYVVIAAAKVGGIYANNTYPADFIYQNTMIQSNLIHSAYKCGINSLVFFGDIIFIKLPYTSLFNKFFFTTHGIIF